jgi:hypothetical protein
MNMVRFFVARILVELAKVISKLAINIAGDGYLDIQIASKIKPLNNKDVDFWVGISLLILAISIFWCITPG